MLEDDGLSSGRHGWKGMGTWEEHPHITCPGICVGEGSRRHGQEERMTSTPAVMSEAEQSDVAPRGSCTVSTLWV